MLFLLTNPYFQKSNCMEFRLCTNCNSPNPIYIKNCLTCESRLAVGLTNIFKFNGKFSMQVANNKTNNPSHSLTCIYCKRENYWNARFCDWCGAQFPPVNPKITTNSKMKNSNFLIPNTSVFMYCIKCDLPNPKEANYCSYCGLTMIPPPKNWGWMPKSCDDCEQFLYIYCLFTISA